MIDFYPSRSLDLRAIGERMTQKSIPEHASFVATHGSQDFGSGGYAAGWKVLEGKIHVEKIFGSEKSSQFFHSTDYKLTPITSTAIVDVWDYDCIGRIGEVRHFGYNGHIRLIKGD